MTCSICLCDYDKRSMTIKCNHTFCVDCLLEHISKSKNNKINCPLCRREFFSKIEYIKPKVERRYLNRQMHYEFQEIENNLRNQMISRNNNMEDFRIKNFFTIMGLIFSTIWVLPYWYDVFFLSYLFK